MRLPYWLRPLVARPKRNPVRRTSNRPAFRPRVETLEDRVTPAGGALDPTFGAGGILTVPVDTYRTQVVNAVQADGKILSAELVLGSNSYQPAVTRLKPDGTVDTTFGTNGTVKLPVTQAAPITALAVAPDGKILVGFSAYTKTSWAGSSDIEYAVGRLNPNGTLDTTFGNNHGYWLYNPTANDEVVDQLAIVPAAGGGYSVIVGGTAAQADGSVSFAAAKLTQAGLLDPTFGAGGLAVRKVSTGVKINNAPTSMAVTTSGEIVFEGWVGTAPGTALYGRVLVGLTPAGQLDTGFGANGVVTLWAAGVGGAMTTTLPITYYAMSQAEVTAQGNSLIVAGSVAVNDASGNGRVAEGYVVRYTPAGALDSTFGTGGIYLGPASLTTGSSVFYQVAVGGDRSIALVGWSGYNDANGVNHHGLIVGHLTADGMADPGFGTAGTGLVIRYDLFPATSFGFYSLCVDPNGNLLVGLTTTADQLHNILMRFTVA